jgi:hypothetical protein
MARRVRFFNAQIEKETAQYPTSPVPVRALGDSAPLASVGPRASQTRDELDVVLAEHESRLSQMNDSYATLSARQRELVEARHVLRETAVFFDRVSCNHRFCLYIFNIRIFRPEPLSPTSALPSMMAPSLFCRMMQRPTYLRPDQSNLISNS